MSLIRDTNEDSLWDPDGVDDTFGTADDERILATVTTDAVGSYQFTGAPLADTGKYDLASRTTCSKHSLEFTNRDYVKTGAQPGQQIQHGQRRIGFHRITHQVWQR